MAKDEDLKEFKISDMSRAPAASTAPTPAPEAAPPGNSLGFARIEAVLDHANPQEIGDGFNALLGALETHHGAVKTEREKSAAKKSALAIERTVDLLDYLYRTKDALMQNADGNT